MLSNEYLAESAFYFRVVATLAASAMYIFLRIPPNLQIHKHEADSLSSKTTSFNVLLVAMVSGQSYYSSVIYFVPR